MFESELLKFLDTVAWLRMRRRIIREIDQRGIVSRIPALKQPPGLIHVTVVCVHECQGELIGLGFLFAAVAGYSGGSLPQWRHGSR